MHKRLWILATMLLLTTTMTSGMAEDVKLKPWQEKAKNLILKNFPRARDVGWPNGTLSLWIFMYTPKFKYSYETVTSNSICTLLEIAGKPKDELVIVTYWSFEG